MIQFLILASGAAAAYFYLKYRNTQTQVGQVIAQVESEVSTVTQETAKAATQIPVVGKFFVNSESVKAIARAIAFAEGFYVDGSRAQRNHNPGDLTADIGGNSIHPIAFDGPFAVYASDDDGFADLYQQITLWLTGQSHVAGPNDTISSLASKYTATDVEAWAKNVAASLGVPTNTQLSSLA